ncbi:MAG: choice-of-anchor J domain-containing protein, partial [Bacteroidales bacterium]|nr:choice-of-anchor J domain-containing protein [Bacteroidales bacterium]
MKIKRLILSLLACAALVTACEEQEEDSLIPSIEITASEMNIGEPGDVQTVSITSNRHWEVTTDANWIAVEPESGEASSAPVSVTVTILENTGYDRTAAVKFNAGNDGKYFDYKTLTVTQTGPKGAPSGDDGTQGTVDDPYSVGKAIYILNNGTYTSDKVYVKGIISRIDEVDTGFGNATYFISDDGGNTIQLEVYRGNYLGGAKITSADQIKVGDEVIVYGVLTIYKGTLEFTQGSEIYSLNGEGGETPGDYAYSIDFTQSQKGWTIKDINKPDGVEFIWAPDTKYGYKATGFVNQVRYKTESYIVSPALVIEEGEPGIAYSAAANFFNGKVDQLCGVLVREVTPDGAGEWVRLEGAGFTENGWNFSDQTASLADYAGKTVQVAFRYTSDGTDTGTGTLEVKNFKANATVDESLTPDDPEPEPEPATYSYNINFTSSQEGWRVRNVGQTSPDLEVWKVNPQYGYVAQAYIDGERYMTDSYLISPALVIEGDNPGIAYSAAANFF